MVDKIAVCRNVLVGLKSNKIGFRILTVGNVEFICQNNVYYMKHRNAPFFSDLCFDSVDKTLSFIELMFHSDPDAKVYFI